ncbi:MAG: hypothetical protein JWO36_2761 [Myxococcales bacterium]|nr:hypothetical protein [Myxococcales bacterium]
MSRPREILPRSFYLLNRRCTQRMFLLRPDEATNNAFVYCLGYAAQCCQVDIILPSAESNHHHTTLFDRYGRICEFAQMFHSLLARSQNALRGRWENLWSAEEPCIVRLVDRADVIAKTIYAASNPVKDLLVERVHHWPGVNGYTNLIYGRPLEATRPKHFFSDAGDMPEKVTLTLTIPAELGPADEVIREVREGVEAVEASVLASRRASGARVLGVKAVGEQSWRDSPTRVEPRRNLRPRFAAANPNSRIATLLRYRAFLEAYRDARDGWLAGRPADFPQGTYWLKKFANVPLAPPT